MSNSNPHDAFFQHLLGHADTAIAALSSWLPAGVEVDWETLRFEPTVTREVFGGERRTDFVFSVRTRARGTLLLYVHVEHQRTVQVFMAVRTVQYQMRIVQAWLRTHRRRGRRLPVVVSVVVYNGDEPWTAETAYEGLVDPGLSRVVGVYQLRASYILVDLAAIAEELLAAAAHPHLRLGLLLMRAASRRAGPGGWEVLVRWARLIGEVALLPGGQERVDALFEYAGALFGAPAREVYDEIEARATPEGRAVMQSWQDVLRSEGRREGRDEGVLVGEILTWARVRFGSVPEDVVARVKAGSADDLQRWRAAVESVEHLAALFGAPE